MDQNIKHRLVGIIVIFALAVIFLPIILDGSGLRKDDFEVVIPPPPEVKNDPDFDEKIIELNARVEAVPELEQHFVDESSTDQPVISESSAAETVQQPDVAAESAPQQPQQAAAEVAKTGGDSWVLQVGSFQDRDKALAQRDKMRKSNIAAVFIEQFDVDGKTSYRVRLGPFINREQSRVAQNKIKAKHDIGGIIMKYER